jgi:hypothetical protein
MTGALEYKLIDIPLLSDRSSDINTDYRHSRKAWDVISKHSHTKFFTGRRLRLRSGFSSMMFLPGIVEYFKTEKYVGLQGE